MPKQLMQILVPREEWVWLRETSIRHLIAMDNNRNSCALIRILAHAQMHHVLKNWQWTMCTASLPPKIAGLRPDDMMVGRDSEVNGRLRIVFVVAAGSSR